MPPIATLAPPPGVPPSTAPPASAPPSSGPPSSGPPAGGPPASAPPPSAPPSRPRPSPPRLEVPPYALADALALERALGIGHVLAQVLVRRGLADPARARAFLAAGDRHDPAEFRDLDRALSLVRRHIRERGRIVVHGDYDVDGVCATAIMVRALRSLGADVGWYLPSRTEDGYGLAAATVERLAGRGAALIVTVDCGITAVDEVAAARAAGVDVVVCDHHSPRPDEALPDCPVVHPAVCGYPCPDLCGTGVALKLAEALGAPTAAEDLDLVALATVADLVPLLGENRRLVREGLAALAGTAKPGLRALMSVSQCDPSAVDTGSLGFRLAPRINAAGRLRRADAGLELLLTDDPVRAQAIAAELDAVNGERRAVEQRILWEAEAQVTELGPRSAYVLAGEDWHPGVVGIVASRIVESHHRPAVLIALSGDGGTGSGRSIPGFDLLAGLRAGGHHLLRFGGHRAAAGLTIDRARVKDFRTLFEAHADAVLTPELLAPVERVDAVVSGHELGLGLVEELEALEPCGLGNPAPRLLVPAGRLSDVRPMGEGRHARFTVLSGGTRARAVAFGCDGRVGEGGDQPHDATFKLERNTWNGAVEPRLVLRHAQLCRPRAPITLLGEDGGDYLAAVLSELDAVPGLGQAEAPPARDLWTGAAPAGSAPAGSAPAGAAPAAAPPLPATSGHRTVVDRRGHSPVTVLVDAVAGGGSVLAVCADVPRRLPGLQERVGGFTLASYAELEREPVPVGAFDQVVALDPPAGRAAARVLQVGAGTTHLAWGGPELRFAQQIHELEYGLRASLVAFYRALRARERAVGEELERLLRGDGPHSRSARLAARLIRVLAELELVSLDRDLPALAITGGAPTALDRSASFRVYAERYEDGLRFLSSANHLSGG